MSGDVEREPRPELLAARRAIEELRGVQLLEDWGWVPRVGRWVARYRLSPPVNPGGLVPSETDWYVLADDAYPWGHITFYPSKDGGLQLTFPHQHYNGPGNGALPWRAGDPCLDTTVRILGRREYDEEPYAVHERLRWRFLRALAWLEAASRGTLTLPGDPFELPDFPDSAAASRTIAFAEGRETFPVWRGMQPRAGLVDLIEVQSGFWVTTRYRKFGARAVTEPRWGNVITGHSGTRGVGLWLRLAAPPVLAPWQAPSTWGELREACRTQALDLDALLAEALESAADRLRDGRRHVALLGFPIPEVSGGDPIQWHWQALLLPLLSRSGQAPRGFRPTPAGQWRRDRANCLRDADKIEWVSSENWHAEQLESRGRMPGAVIGAEILVVGAGALGSAIAELLGRTGAHRILLMDGDRLAAGNLVRHTLDMHDLGAPKASAVVRHLNQSSPHGAASAIDQPFPPTVAKEIEQVRRCNVVIDCTGDDLVLNSLERFTWEGVRLFASCSLSLGAQRAYCFAACAAAFPHAAFRQAMRPWFLRDAEEREGQPLPREGVGCWHPVFPARADDVWLLASVVVKWIVTRIGTSPSSPELIVFEQFNEDGCFAGVRRSDAA